MIFATVDRRSAEGAYEFEKFVAFVLLDDKCGISIGAPGERVNTQVRPRNSGRLVHTSTSTEDMAAMDHDLGTVAKATPSVAMFTEVGGRFRFLVNVS